MSVTYKRKYSASIEARVTPTVREAFKELSAEFGTTMSEAIRKMIEEKVYSEAPKKLYNSYGYDEDFVESVYGGKK
jgi:F0F1-type ATP synthase membrane subunit b/b'